MATKTPITGVDWESNIKKAVALILEKEKFLFGASLDPDSVGSMLSLALYLHLLGKTTYLIIKEPLGSNFDFLEKIISHNKLQIIASSEQLQEIKKEVHLVMFFDTANSKLLPFYADIKKNFLSQDLPVIEFDHHFGTDSEELSANSVKLYRKANANTEIIAELLLRLHEKAPALPHPFSRRNILLSLITGLLSDTVNGKVVHFKEDYEYWMEKLGKSLQKETYTENRETKNFSDQRQVSEYIHNLAEDQRLCLELLSERIVTDKGLGMINLLDSICPEVCYFCQPFDTVWFVEVRDFLLNMVPEKAGKVGILCYNGKDSTGADCMYIKMRRATKYQGYDLRGVENTIKETFGNLYMGGGGHAGAVSFRVRPHGDNPFLDGVAKVSDFIKNHLT